MRKHYGLISFILSLFSWDFTVFWPAPMLAVAFAVLYKARGDRENKRQRIFARIGFIVGTAALCLFTIGLWAEILIFSDGILYDILPFGLAIAVGILALWLYKRAWKSQ